MLTSLMQTQFGAEIIRQNEDEDDVTFIRLNVVGIFDWTPQFEADVYSAVRKLIANDDEPSSWSKEGKILH